MSPTVLPCGRSLIVKICGLTRPREAVLAARLGADWLGFIFHPGSPRYVALAVPASLEGLPARKVGVFVHQEAGEVRAAMDAAGLSMAQLHGGQDPEFCRRVGAERVIRVFWPERHPTRESLMEEMHAFRDAAAYFLLDAGTSGGGHGRALDPAFLEGLESPVPLILAGGLSPENAARAAALPGIAGLDVNSGVESAPGVKDIAKLEALFHLLKQEQPS
ncbi:N-(5'-phosphoribosyl)anthranilate isomerase [Desulfovibrio sp. X2]|uniref:phosphoribosylanthranilate isomerase n=1 Tax=Desulfovibrio sp. X2 TaxID=941449 RepID=UPI00035892D4|nr:phosphoribosylanthranilate isomerase [Desulfovibrio sp. X2]EPR36304.1 N-(5'-phosphoribosyl)anthranilate isomerase [Desulfovibrio sp. X2]